MGFFSFSVQAANNLIDRIVAVVNGEIITMAELEKNISVMMPEAANKPKGPDIYRQGLMQMVEKKLIEQEAKKLKVEVNDRDVDRAVEQMLQGNKISLKDLTAALTEQGMTIEEYRDFLRAELIRSQVVGQQVQAKVSITDEDMIAYYEKNLKPEEKPGARVRLQQILLAVPPNGSEEDAARLEKTLQDIREKILGGENFGRMAAMYSQGPAAKTGGDLGYFHKGEMMPEIETAAFSIEEGAVSPVIKTQAGFHLIKVLDKSESEQDRSWKDRQNEISNALYNREFERIYKEWMEGLQKKSYIELNL